MYTHVQLYMKKNLLRLKICYLKIIKKMYEKDFKYLEPITSKLNNKQQYTDKSRNDEKNLWYTQFQPWTLINEFDLKLNQE